MAALASRKTWKIIGVIAAVAALIIGAVVISDRSRDGTVDDPWALAIVVHAGDRDIRVMPYRVCNVLERGDGACRTDAAATAHVSIGEADTAELEVPDEVASVAWAVQRFYADETVNAADRKEPGSAPSETIAGSASVNGRRTPLGVVEVSTTVVGKDASGADAAYGITWSVANDAGAR